MSGRNGFASVFGLLLRLMNCKDLLEETRVFHQAFSDRFPALSQSLISQCIPGTGACDGSALKRHVDELSRLIDARSVANLCFHHPKRWCKFVFRDTNASAVPDVLSAVFYAPDSPDVQAEACVEFHGVSTGGDLIASEGHPDFLTQLIDEHDRCALSCGQGHEAP